METISNGHGTPSFSKSCAVTLLAHSAVDQLAMDTVIRKRQKFLD
jgi:hypothetical protein